MGKWERSKKSVSYSAHHFVHSGRGLKHTNIPQRKIEEARWHYMKHHAPKSALVYRLYSIHRINNFDKALATYVTEAESIRQKWYKKRLTLAFRVFRLTASFLLFLAFDRTFASVEKMESIDGILTRSAMVEQYLTRRDVYCSDKYSPSAASFPFSSGCVVSAHPWQNYLKSGNETVNIEGYVKGDHYNNPIENAKVVLIRTDNEQRLDSVYTDAAGHYKKQWIVSLTDVGLEGIVENKAYPNPCADEVNVSFNALKNDKYQMRTYSLDGKLVSDVSLDLKQGGNLINVKGGASGVQIIRITNGEQKEDYKIIRMQSTNAPLEYEVTSVAPRFKSTTDGIDGVMVGQEIKLEFTAPTTTYTNYLPGDTTFIVQTSQTANKKLEQIPVTNDFLIDAYSIVDGTPVIAGTALKVNWGDGSSNVYSSTNGQIHILRENTYDTATMIHLENADTSFYQEWIFGVKKESLDYDQRKESISEPERTIASGAPLGPGGYYYPTPAPANILALPNNFDVYFVPNLVYNSENEAFNTRGVFFRSVASCARGPPDFTKKWEFIPQVADTLNLYEMQMYDDDLNNLITPAQSLLQKAAMDSTETQLFYLQGNGRHLMPPYKRVNITTKTEPEWLEGQARGFDQTHKIKFGPGNNNGCTFTLDYAWGGWWRFKYADASYEINSNMTFKMSEMISSFLHCRDPRQGNLGGYVVGAGNTGSMTSFGKALHMILLADPGTKFW